MTATRPPIHLPPRPVRRRLGAAYLALLLAAALLALPAPAAADPEPAAPPAAPGDGPLPTISVDEVERGMTGYGLSVFVGEAPERFEAEVVGVMRNTAPDVSYILVRLSGHGLEESGVPGGMSGSPVYLDGRLAGAVAFAWPFSQEAIAGVTPIAQMRRLADAAAGNASGSGAAWASAPDSALASASPAAPPSGSGAAPAPAPGLASAPVPVSAPTIPPVPLPDPATPAPASAPTAPPVPLPDPATPAPAFTPAPAAPPLPLADLVAGTLPEGLLERELARLVPNLAAGAVPGVQWAASGFGAGPGSLSLGLLERSLGSVVPLGVAAPAADGGAGPEELVHGGAVAAVLVDGDLRLAATGTVTDLHDGAVLAFGHPFLGLGPLSVPMATSEVVTVLASDYNSFKISNVGRIVGAFQQDRQAGLLGRIGAEAAMIPVTVRVDGRPFHMRVAEVPQLTASLLAIATLGAVDTAAYTSGLQGIDLTARFVLGGHDDLVVRQSFDGAGAAPQGASFVLTMAGFLTGTDLAELDLEAVEIDVAQVRRPRTATLVGAHAQRTVVRPGETVTLNLDFSVWRGEDFRRRVEVKVPEDVSEGRYYLFVGDGSSVDAARIAVEPTDPVNIRQALELLRSLSSRRELAVLGVAAGRGLAVAGEALPNLPGTVRSIWSAAPSGSARPLRLAVRQRQGEAMDVPLSGLVRIDLEVERREPLRAATGSGGDGSGGDGSEAGATGDGEPGGAATGAGASAAAGSSAGGAAGEGSSAP